MVRVELSYNPYIQETIVKFNGQDPRINSLVEKYQDKKLQTWLNSMPDIFHDEMNGYGFELCFSGTKKDYDRVIDAFYKNGVNKEDVVFFFKNELEDTRTKNNRVNELIAWLRENRNRRFDYDNFYNENKEIIDSPYSFVTIHGGKDDSVRLFEEELTVENIDNIDELSNTDILDTPIVYFVVSSNPTICRNELRKLTCKDGFDISQLFFCIDTSLNKGQIIRTLSDLGYRNPKIINTMDDGIVEDYFDIYPLTNYIKCMIEIFNTNISSIQVQLDGENEVSRIKNNSIHEEIYKLDDSIHKLKESDDMFYQKDNLNVSNLFDDAYSELLIGISEWRRKKTKTTNNDEAEKMAAEYDAELEKNFRNFKSKVIVLADTEKNRIANELGSWYARAAVDTAYRASVAFDARVSDSVLPKLFGEFLKIRTEEMVDVKADFLGFFFSNTEKKEQILETTFQYEDWRKYAVDKYIPIARELIDNRINALVDYYEKLSDKYHEHIDMLLSGKTESKINISAQLSDDEKMLQDDNDWLEEFKDKVRNIERG